MTCNELHSYFEACPQDASSLTPEAASHLLACAECRAFVDERHELGRSLRLVRESVPAISEALDVSVLARYRHHLAEPRYLPARWRIASRWGVAVATVGIAVSIFWLVNRHHATAGPPITPKPAVAATSTVAVSTVPEPAVVHPQPVHHNSKQRGTARTIEPSAVSSARPRVPQISERFRSLMFCDELSCVGDMDVVRVQLPSAFVPRPASALPQPTGFVNADVLVGPDGIARGIRIEQ